MEKLIVRGGKSLKGTVKVSGAKYPADNSRLPAFGRNLYFAGYSACYVTTICKLIERLGARITRGEREVTISVPDLKETEAPYEYVRLMRASFLVMGLSWPVPEEQ